MPVSVQHKTRTFYNNTTEKEEIRKTRMVVVTKNHQFLNEVCYRPTHRDYPQTTVKNKFPVKHRRQC